MSTKRIALGLLILQGLILTGCATVYHKPNATSRDLDHDLVECEVKKGQAHGADEFLGRTFIERCMSGLGWDIK